MKLEPRPGAGRTAVGIAVAAILLVGLAYVTYGNVRQVIDERNWVSHSYDVLGALNRVTSTVKDAESAQRNYLLTGDENFLPAFDVSRGALPDRLGELRRLVRDNPRQAARATEIEKLVARRVELMLSNIHLRRTAGLDAAVSAIIGRPPTLMDQIRRVASEMETEETRLLQARSSMAERTARTALIALAIGGILLFLFLGLIWALIYLDLLKRAAAEDELRRSEAELRTTLRSIGDAVLATDARGRIILMNPVAEQLTEWPEADALGRSSREVFRIVNEITGEPGEDLVARVLSEGRIILLANHMTLISRGGAQHPIADSAAPIRDAGGEILGVVLVFRNIEEKRRADRELQRLAAIVAFSEDAIIAESLDGTITAWNAGAERLLGYSAAEAIGQSVNLLEPPDSEDNTMSRLARIRQGHRVQQFDTTRVHKDGRRLAVSVSVSPVRDAENRIIGASKIIRDITDRKLTELALRASEERFRVLSDSVGSLVWVCDENGTATYLNRRWSEYTGLPERESLRDGWVEAVHPEDRKGYVEKWQFSVASGEAFESEVRFRRDDGTFRWFVSRAEKIHSRSGPLWVGTATDIDDLKNTSAALRQAKESAEEASRAKDRFLAVLSHELRTPLTPALATSQLLERRHDVPEDVREALKLLRRNVELETLLVDDLLDLTKITRGTIELRRQREDLHGVIQHVVDICRSDLLGKRQLLHLDLRARERLAEVDPARIQQVFWNLVKNAVKFTPVGGTITIRSENPAPDRIRIAIADTGMGIPAGILHRVFEPFEQGPRSISPRAGGLGLGLAISRTLVTLHGGTIRAESDGEGKGATLTVELDAVEEKSLPSAGRPSGQRAFPRRPLRILLVEDHPDTASALSQLLSEEGHTVEVASTLEQALSAFPRDSYELVITDLGLPDGSGHELFERLRQIRPVKGIALSGYGMDSDLARSRAAGFSEHLTKPVQIGILLGAINRVAVEG